MASAKIDKFCGFDFFTPVNLGGRGGRERGREGERERGREGERERGRT
jgi:hypothetical protein